MTVANLVSLIRICMTPLFLYLFFSSTDPSRVLVAVVFVLTGITDALDGYLARSRHEVSRLGKLIDPLADKLVMAAAFISLAIVGKLPLWLVFVLVGKELALVFGAAIYYFRKDLVVSSSILGKSATVILYIGTTLVILGFEWAVSIVIVGVAVSLVAGLDYLRRVLGRPK